MIKCQQDLVANWKSTSACPTPVWTAACAKTWPVVTHVTVPLDSQGTAVRSTLMSVTALPAWMEARAWMLWTVSGNKRPDGKQEWWDLLLEINSAGKSTHFWWDVLYLRDEVDTDRMWSVFKVKVPSCAVSYCAALLKTANKTLLYTLVFFLCVRCQCVEGYRGRLCEVDVDECDPNPCVNGASCLDGLGSYTCRCLPGFNGTRCETGTIGQMAHHHGNSRWRRTGKDVINVKCFQLSVTPDCVCQSKGSSLVNPG